MKKLLIEPFTNSTPSGRRLIALLMILQTLMACNYQIIPMIFFRPRFYCQQADGLAMCHELDACLETPVKFRSDYAFSSISMEFGFYCDTKKDEATILTFMMVGHLVGAVASTLLSDLGHHKRSVMAVLILNALSSAICCLAAGLASTPFTVGLALTIWSFSSEMILNFLNMVPTLYFSSEMAKKVFSLIVISWSMYSWFTPATLSLHLSWRALFIVNLAVPWSLWVAYTLYHRNELMGDDTQRLDTSQQLLTADQKKEMNQEALQPTTNATYRDVVKSSHFCNIVLYFLVFGGSNVAAMSSTLTLGGLNGNIYFNLTVICIIELTLSLIGGYIAHSISVMKSLSAIYLLMTISYALYSVLPEVLRSFVVLQGKLLTDVTWVMLASLTIIITPPRFIPMIVSARAIYILGVSLLMPYTKYFMELIRLSIFVFSAVYEAVAYICLRSIRERDLSLP